MSCQAIGEGFCSLPCSDVNGYPSAFTYTNSVVQHLSDPGEGGASALGINNDGVVFLQSKVGNQRHILRYASGSATDLEALNDSNFPITVNSHAQAAGAAAIRSFRQIRKLFYIRAEKW